MATLNYLNCETKRGNVGKAKCSRTPKVWIGGILIPKGYVLTAAELVDFKTTLQNRFVHDDSLQRFYPIGRFVGITDNSEEQQDFTYPDGTKEKTRDAVYDWLYQHRESRCYHTSLRKFDESQDEFDILGFDKDYFVLGTQGDDVDGNPGLAGYSLSRINVPFLTQATYDTPATMAFGISLEDGKQYNELYAEAELGSDMLKLQAIQDVDLSLLANGAAGVFTIGATVGCGATNLTEIVGADLAVAGLWVATNAQTGVAITISSVAVNASGTGYTLTLSTVDPDYPATGFINISLAAVSVLAAADLTYYESNVLRVART